MRCALQGDVLDQHAPLAHPGGGQGFLHLVEMAADLHHHDPVALLQDGRESRSAPTVAGISAIGSS